MKNPFKLDTPSSLPSRMFQNKEGEYTWEDWEEENKAKYPIRFWLSKTMPSWFRVKISMPLDELRYWVKSYLIRKDHKLDIRNPQYEWGFCTAGEQILYSIGAIMEKYKERIEYTMGDDLESLIIWLDKILKDHPNDIGAANQKEIYILVRDFLKWWKEDWPNKRWDDTTEEENEWIMKIIPHRKELWT